MANARTRFDAISTELQQHGATQGLLYGKQALFIEGRPFMLLHRDAAGVRLSGRVLAEALALEGSVEFDPIAPEEATQSVPGWVRLPAQHFLAWDGYAREAFGFAQLSLSQPVSWRVPPAPPDPTAAAAPSDPDSLAARAAAALKGGFRFDLS